MSDSGIGIPSERISNPFAPFIQADTSTTRRFGGTGLGLSISQRLAEAMGGSISVDSTEGRGSTFSFSIVLLAYDQPLTDEPADRLPGVRVLAVSAQRSAAPSFERQLHPKGVRSHIVRSASSGLRAYRELLAADRPAHVVLVDHVMPDHDGPWLAAQLRALQAPPGGTVAASLVVEFDPRCSDRARRPRHHQAGEDRDTGAGVIGAVPRARAVGRRQTPSSDPAWLTLISRACRPAAG